MQSMNFAVEVMFLFLFQLGSVNPLYTQFYLLFLTGSEVNMRIIITNNVLRKFFDNCIMYIYFAQERMEA